MSSALLVAPYYPYPIDSGSRVSLHGYVVALKNANIKDIDIICFEQPTSPDQIFRSCFHIEKPKKFTIRGIIKFWLGKSILLSRYFSRSAAQKIQSVIQAERYDYIIFQHAYMAQYADLIEISHSPTKIIVSSEVLESRAFLEKSNLARNYFLRRLLRREAKILDTEETKAMNNFDLVTFFSQEDQAHYLQQGGKSPSVHINLGLDMDRYKPLGQPKNKDFTLAFFGSFGWFANEDALRYLLDDIWPVVRKKNPEVRLKIAGKDIPSWALLRNDSHILFCGRVDSIRDFLEDVNLVLSPIRIGGGVRLKMLESYAWGRPVLSTRAGLEGLEPSLAKLTFEADSPEEFSNVIQKIIDGTIPIQSVEDSCLQVRRMYDAKNLSGIFINA